MNKYFKIQKDFQKKLYDIDNLSEDDKIKYTKEFILCIHRELGEVLNVIPWKLHRKNNKVYSTDELKEELIDTTKFLLNLFLIWGVDDKEFDELFEKKSKIVEERYKNEIENI